MFPNHCLGGLFFFRAEVGIRFRTVTGVQTCALPICQAVQVNAVMRIGSVEETIRVTEAGDGRSEERRVGKECRSRWTPNHGKKKEASERWAVRQGEGEEEEHEMLEADEDN